MSYVSEANTGFRFPARFTPPSGAAPPPRTLSAFGTGLREASLLGVNVWVYSVACHVDEDQARVALEGFRGRDSTTLLQDEGLFSKIIDGPFDTCLTICFYRTITHAQFAHGIAEALQPRLAALGAPPETLRDFMASLDELPPPEQHARVFLHLQPPDRITVSGLAHGDVPHDLLPPTDTESQTVVSTELSRALRDVYFGPGTVVPSLRTGIAEAVARLLNPADKDVQLQVE